ncbi:hypothetical protein DEJ50_15830 [Streptomyces venezuelae]|uniref:Uncharacterized protein n=1 Tax=Streptomyces venezuelae TaxID=54571 RepID=A0A5P2D4G2_STRVZ|nr:hypothetical protein [Streptomyces venezuelae]QES49057.1 hypothetical protein DEJ50_15830 [Streptomyces venezuelae]
MAAHNNAQGPEGNYDPAGSTQMFRAFVDEGEPARQGATAGRGRRASGSTSVSWLGFAFGMVLLIGAVAWLALR